MHVNQDPEENNSHSMGIEPFLDGITKPAAALSCLAKAA
jgi:hypothetical protein